MKVYEAVEALSRMNQNADVELVTQPTWPLAYDVRSIVEYGDRVWVLEGSPNNRNNKVPDEIFDAR